MSTPAIAYDRSDPVIDRLEDQIQWYDKKSTAAQHAFKRIKVTEIIAAAAIPFLSVLKAPEWTHLAYATAFLGALITVLESLLHLNQYQHNWINYRSTCEELKHEKFVYLAGAPPYDGPNARAHLAERVESLVSQEEARWAAVQTQEGKKNSNEN
jgi:hypothetical protein